MARQSRKVCIHVLPEIQAHFPSPQWLCKECAVCPLLRKQGPQYHCGFIPGAPGRVVHPRPADKRAKLRTAILLEGMVVKGLALSPGTEVILDRQQNAGTYLWVSLKHPGRQRLGKFLVQRGLLDLDGPLVDVSLDAPVTKIGSFAVLIQDIWFPLHEVREVVLSTGHTKAVRDLREADQIHKVVLPEWLARLKGLV